MNSRFGSAPGDARFTAPSRCGRSISQRTARTKSVSWIQDTGESASLRGLIAAPAVPGRYALRLEMVSDGVTWFGDVNGGAPLCLDVDVR